MPSGLRQHKCANNSLLSGKKHQHIFYPTWRYIHLQTMNNICVSWPHLSSYYRKGYMNNSNKCEIIQTLSKAKWTTRTVHDRPSNSVSTSQDLDQNWIRSEMQVAQHKQTSTHYWSETKVSETANSPVEGIYSTFIYFILLYPKPI